MARDQRDRAVKAEAEATARADELKTVSDFQVGMLARISPPQAGDELTEDVTAKYAEALAKADPPIPEAEHSALVATFTNQWSRVNSTDVARGLIDRTIFIPAIETIDTEFADQPVVDAALRQVLASQYLQLGRFDAAVPLQEQALEIRRRVLGDDHPDTLDSVQALVDFYEAWAEAAPGEGHAAQASEWRAVSP